MNSEVLKDVKLSYKRENHTSSKIDDDLIVVAGGWNGSKAMDSVEVFRFNSSTKSLELITTESPYQSLKYPRNKPCLIVI